MFATNTVQSMPSQRPKLSVILTEDVRGKLEELAETQERSLSQMALILIRDGIEQAERDGKLSDRAYKKPA